MSPLPDLAIWTPKYEELRHFCKMLGKLANGVLL